jgi:hypothetical protein
MNFFSNIFRSIQIFFLRILAGAAFTEMFDWMEENYDKIEIDGHTQFYKLGSCYVCQIMFRTNQWGYVTIDYDTDNEYFEVDYNKGTFQMNSWDWSLFMVFFNRYTQLQNVNPVNNEG